MSWCSRAEISRHRSREQTREDGAEGGGRRAKPARKGRGAVGLRTGRGYQGATGCSRLAGRQQNGVSQDLVADRTEERGWRPDRPRVEGRSLEVGGQWRSSSAHRQTHVRRRRRGSCGRPVADGARAGHLQLVGWDDGGSAAFSHHSSEGSANANAPAAVVEGTREGVPFVNGRRASADGAPTGVPSKAA